jgi:AcrR family transcriptional regulator
MNERPRRLCFELSSEIGHIGGARMAKHLPDPRDRIIDAALFLFARFGVTGTTLADVAQRAHLGKTTLYHHFPDGKATIFKAAVRHAVRGHWAAFESSVRSEPCSVTRLARYVRLRVETFDREIARWGVTQPAWETMKPLVHEALEPYYADELALLTELVSEGIRERAMRSGRAETIAQILQAAFRGLSVDGRVDSTAQARAAELVELAVFIEGGLLDPSAIARWRAAITAR